MSAIVMFAIAAGSVSVAAGTAYMGAAIVNKFRN